MSRLSDIAGISWLRFLQEQGIRMQQLGIKRKQTSFLWSILKLSRKHHEAGDLNVESLLKGLDDKSFAWAILVFALFAMLPFPPGATLLTALPLLLVTAQMTLGYRHLNLPSYLLRIKINYKKLRKTVLLLRPFFNPLEKLSQERYQNILQRKCERIIGVALFAVSFALFLPIPLSGWLCAFALFVYALGAVEGDGLVASAGLILGGICLLLTGAIVSSMALALIKSQPV